MNLTRRPKHTPGPWTFDSDGGVRDSEDTLIAWVHPHGNINTVARTGEEFSHADARLIAAAPKMLAALAMVMERWETHDGQIHDITLVRDAIAAALGDDDKPEVKKSLREGLAEIREAVGGALDGVGYCTLHRETLKVGEECAYCLQDNREGFARADAAYVRERERAEKAEADVERLRAQLTWTEDALLKEQAEHTASVTVAEQMTAALRYVSERWDSHDGQVGRIDDVRAALAAYEKAVRR